MLRSSISIPEAFAHVGGERVPDKPSGHDVLDVIHSTVHGFLPGTAVLAERMGMSRDVLQQKANRNNGQHVFHPQQLVDLMRQTGNAAVLHCIAEQLGYTVTRAMPDQSGGDPVQAIMEMHCALSDFMRAVADPLAPLHDGADMGAGRYVTSNEMRRATATAADLHTAIGNVLATLRGRMRPAPAAE